MKSNHKLLGNFSLGVVENSKKYLFAGLDYKGEQVIADWEDLAFLLVIMTSFSRKELKKNVSYNIGPIKVSRVEKNNNHSLRVYVNNEVVFLDEIEVKFFPAICNRIIARCDILHKNNQRQYSYEYEPSIDNYEIIKMEK